MNYKIPLLTADDVECRVQSMSKDNTTAFLLLYKDARVDMRILDEVFGAMNWQRHHSRDNANCIISVWDEDKRQWVEKEDTGTESQTEAAKGIASDSFKRAGFNWGIGRELYDAPFIAVDMSKDEFNKFGKLTTRFKVKEMSYNEQTRQFDTLKIVDGKGNVRFELGKKIQPKAQPKPQPKADNHAEQKQSKVNMACSICGTKIDKTVSEYSVKTYGAEMCRVCQQKKKQGLI